MDQHTPLYDRDFFLWTEQQAASLRAAAQAGANLPLDWENLAEEIESLGRRDRRELGGRVKLVIEHLLKLQFSSALDPRAGWVETVTTQRDEIEQVLRDSPSLMPRLDDLIATETPRLAKRVGALLGARAELRQPGIEAAAYDRAQILGDWFPS